MTDARGKEINYNYNFNSSNNTGSGTLESVVDAKGNKTTYEYDNLDRITSVKSTTDGKNYSNSYTYSNDRLSNILHNGFNLSFLYDNFGNTKQVKIENNILVTNNYDTGNGNLNSVAYGNNQTISYSYDRFGRVLKKTGTNGEYNYVYDAKGNLGIKKDSVNNVTYNYTYDLANRPIKSQATNGYSSQYKYDKNSNINNITYNLNNLSNSINYFYDNDNKSTSIKLDSDKYVMYDYDRLSRLQDKYLKSGTNSYKTSMTYISDQTNTLKTTTMLETLTNGLGPVISYTYDNNGNIDTISKDAILTQKYYYDGLNQLIREDNVELNKTITYTYDTGGNIQTIDKYDYTTDQDLTPLTKLDTKSYTYDTVWKDKLINYNGKDITYDNIGNPLTYDGNTYTWQNGRQLTEINKEGTNISYKYNDNGIRTQKIVNGVTTNYYLDGDKVIYETTGNNTIYYTYDAESNLIGFKYNNDQYYYVRNGQEDIIGILDNNLNNVISYTYDTWGKLESIKDSNDTDVTNDPTSIGNINPYRYRGYRYDNEIGMYYLQSRYFNPETRRMLNADSIGGNIGEILSHNLYSYCGNNPVNREDSGGCIWQFISSFINDLANTIITLKPVYASAGGAAIADGPLPFGDIIGLGVAAVTTIGAIAYSTQHTINTNTKSRTQTLTDTKPKVPSNNAKVYQAAYVDKNTNELKKIGSTMTYNEAKSVLLLNGGLTNIVGRNNRIIGIYSTNQSYAKSLAVSIGIYEKEVPEVHGDGFYGHYHDANHRYHIWYGNQINY